MNTRLQQFLAAENISQAQFADYIDVARASVSHILAGRNKPGYEFMANMVRRYPNLNIDWLLTGKGKMYKGVHEDDDNLFRDDPAMTPVVPEKMKMTQKPVENDELFEAAEDIFSEPFPVRVPEKEENIKLSTSIKTKSSNTQPSVNQRKAIKVIVFYNDGTFQEM